MASTITSETDLEDLVRDFPEAVGFLTRRGIRCIRCGEPVWCTLGELLQQQGVNDAQQLINDLNSYLSGERKSP